MEALFFKMEALFSKAKFLKMKALFLNSLSQKGDKGGMTNTKSY